MGAGASVMRHLRVAQDARAAAIIGNLPDLRKIHAAGMPLTAGDANGFTPLYWAAWSGHTACVKFLIEIAGAVVDLQDKTGLTALHRAADRGHLECVQYLIEEAGADIEAKNKFLRTPLFIASATGATEVVRYLVEKAGAKVDGVDENGFTVLHLAARSGEFDTARYLAERAGVDVFARTKRGQSAKHVAMKFSNVPNKEQVLEVLARAEDWAPTRSKALHSAAEGDMPALMAAVRALEEPGMDMNYVCDKNGDTPLHLAAKHGQLEVVEWLVDTCGADLDAINHSGGTPLHYTVQQAETAAMEWLAGRGGEALVNVANNAGNTALHEAVIADNAYAVQWLVSVACADVEAQNKRGDTPLHTACRVGASEGITTFLVHKAGADVLAMNKTGHRCIHLAASSGSLVAVRDILSLELAHATLPDPDGSLPLHLAAMGGHEEVCQFLLEHTHANIGAKDASKKTAFDVAKGTAKGFLRRFMAVRAPAGQEPKAIVIPEEELKGLQQLPARPLTRSEQLRAQTAPLAATSPARAPPPSLDEAKEAAKPTASELATWLEVNGFELFKPDLADCTIDDICALTREDVLEMLGCDSGKRKLKATALYRRLHGTASLNPADNIAMSRGQIPLLGPINAAELGEPRRSSV